MSSKTIRQPWPIRLDGSAGSAWKTDSHSGKRTGGSDHFTRFGAGIYGFNWWFNAAGRLHPEELTWPDAPPDAVMSIGFGGNCAAIVPSLDAALVAAQANWGELEAGKRDTQMNRILEKFADAVKPDGP